MDNERLGISEQRLSASRPLLTLTDLIILVSNVADSGRAVADRVERQLLCPTTARRALSSHPSNHVSGGQSPIAVQGKALVWILGIRHYPRKPDLPSDHWLVAIRDQNG